MSSSHPAATVTLDEMLDGLRRRDAYRPAVENVRVVQTHLSLLFFAGGFVYKVKKPVDLGFVDFTTLEKRLATCEAEVRLNRRMAPHTYLGVVPITRDPGGGFHVDGEGEPVEYAVKMVELPAHRMLDRLLEAGEVDNDLVHRLAALLAGFHRLADDGPEVARHGTEDAVRELVLGNIAELEPFVGTEGDAVLSPRVHAYLTERARAFLTSHRALLAERAARGFVRDGHGDLHAGNICCTRSGITAYDCLEFSDRLRCGDVAADLAFLAMDLDHRGYRAFSDYLVREYSRVADDPAVAWLMDFYKGHRALVRAKVGALLAADPSAGPEPRREAHARARSYAHLAASYALPPTVVLMCGLPATGKSWLARRLAAPFEARILRSDVVRKRLFGIPPTERVPEDRAAEIYAGRATDRVYTILCAEALDSLRHGRSVIVDATFATRRHRRRFIDVARRLDHPTALVHVTCGEDEIRERLARRRVDAREVSDADWEVYLRARRSFEPVVEVAPELRVDAREGESLERVAARLLDRLVAQATESYAERSAVRLEDAST